AQTRKRLEPGFWVEIRVGPGTIFFDTLRWEKAFGVETDKASRILSVLISNLGADLRLQKEPDYDYDHVDLAPFAHRGFYDPVAGDGEGGWTDQGQNDMRFFLINHTGRGGGLDDAAEVTVEKFPERVLLGKRPWRLTDPSANHGKSVLVFRSTLHATNLVARTEEIPVGFKAHRLWFLHTAAWANAVPVHTVIAEYRILYEDGEVEIAPVRMGLNIGEWWDPTPMDGAEVAWTGRNLLHSPVGIWSMPWENPRPDRVIRSISVHAAKTEAQLILLGITGGRLSDAQGPALVARWDLARYADGMVHSSIGEPQSLRAGGSPPTPVEEGQGLRFGGDAELRIHTRRMAGVEPGVPASVLCDVTLEREPTGYWGGVFQAMEYKQSGFRLLVAKSDQRPAVEVVTAPDEIRMLKGKTRLTPGRRTRLEVRME
ncbi:MAG: hypothetical protein U1E27_04865, partial [Kiritimatiellia bacterium]|nr:hypothetical protein [Kiritimatiellia bacterium]